jgi:hypothetical protein
VDSSDWLARVFLGFLVVWFFTKQFILYKRFERRGLYDNQKVGNLKRLYYLRKGWNEGKREFFSE